MQNITTLRHILSISVYVHSLHQILLYLSFPSSDLFNKYFINIVLIKQDQARRGVVAASAGNHALALAYHGQLLHIPVTVVMPIVAPMMKVEACRMYGANVIVFGHDFGQVGIAVY